MEDIDRIIEAGDKLVREWRNGAFDYSLDVQMEIACEEWDALTAYYARSENND